MRKFTVDEAKFVIRNQSKLSLLELADELHCTTKEIEELYSLLLRTYTYRKYQQEKSDRCRINLHKEVTNEGKLWSTKRS